MNKIKITYWIPWFLSLAVTLCISYGMSLPYFKVGRILWLQFAANESIFFQAAAEYPDHQILNNTFLDFCFIVSYSCLFFFSLKLFLQLSEIKNSPNILYCCFLPGLFDAIENGFIIFMVNHKQIDAFLYIIYMACVNLKWVLSIIFITLTLVVCVHQLFTRLSKIMEFFQSQK